MPNVIYEKLRKLAADNGLTNEQVAEATREQAAKMMGIDAGFIDDKVFEVAKGAVVRELERDKWDGVLGDLKEQLVGGDKMWFRNNFPAAEFEIDHRTRTVRIYLEGKPAVEEVQ